MRQPSALFAASIALVVPAHPAFPHDGSGATTAEAKMELSQAPEIPAAPPFLPEVKAPENNPTTAEKVELGYLLFFDRRLSRDDSMSCSTCHLPEMAYTDGKDKSPKVGGMNKRNAPSVQNLGTHASFYWDGRMPTLEAVCQAAWKGQLGADPAAVASKLNLIPGYQARFERAFQKEASPENVPMAFAAFLRVLQSGNAPWDRFEGGDATAVSKDVRAGFEVFKKDAECALCHVPPLYTDADYHNVGVGAFAPEAERDKGRTDATKDSKDDGKFKTPSLRDLGKTGPYFHDGSSKTLDEAIDFLLGGGKKNPNLDPKLKPHKLSRKKKAQLKAFLESLAGASTFPVAPANLP